MKFSIYNHVVHLEDGIYVYNALYSQAVKIRKKKNIEYFKRILDLNVMHKQNKLVKYLYENNYIVDNDVDEFSIAKEKVCSVYNDSGLFIMLYVTNQCNFRCVYCPQEHESKVFSDEYWNALYHFIEKKLQTNLYKDVHISFFGGEPLLEVNAIIDFLERLKTLKEVYPEVAFRHNMTTNGYLLTPGIYDKLVSLDVVWYQITLDGLAKTHNKTRPRVDGAETWDKIIENITYINRKYDGTCVWIRANLGLENHDSIKELFEWFDKKFFNSKFVYFIYGVSAFTSKVDKTMTVSNFGQTYADFLDNVMLKYKKYRTRKYSDLSLRFLSLACKCASSEFYAIRADGKVANCEQAYDEKDTTIGYLSKNGEVVITTDNPRVEEYETEECETCNFYPLCGARACPDKFKKSTSERQDCYLNKGDYLKNFVQKNILYFSDFTTNYD